MEQSQELSKALEELTRATGIALDIHIQPEASKEKIDESIRQIRSLCAAYKQTALALRVGKLFYSEQSVFPFNKLGIGRLLHELPEKLCEDFLFEIFGDITSEHLDKDTLAAIDKFFQNNLNIAETARQLHMHRNTLIYRLEQVEKRTGLDLRQFEDAMTFKIAIMILNYLQSERNVSHE